MIKAGAFNFCDQLKNMKAPQCNNDNPTYSNTVHKQNTYENNTIFLLSYHTFKLPMKQTLPYILLFLLVIFRLLRVYILIYEYIKRENKDREVHMQKTVQIACLNYTGFKDNI